MSTIIGNICSGLCSVKKLTVLYLFMSHYIDLVCVICKVCFIIKVLPLYKLSYLSNTLIN